MGKKTNPAIVWLLLSFVLIFPVKTKAYVRERTFPAPLKTVQQAVTIWLQGTGFRVRTLYSNSQRTDLRAEKETGRWQIVIRPQSALACHVTADWTGFDGMTRDDASAVDSYEQLWAGILKYIQSPNLAQDNCTPIIPEKVHTHIKSVVCIHITTGGNQKQVSGFFINAREGLVISTAHDLMEFQEITVGLSDGRDISGQVVQLDPNVDLALIRVKSISPTGIFLTQSRNLLSLGDQLYTIGCPTNHGGMVTPGIVNGPPRRAAGQLLWQVKMKILPGNSGSPVFDEQGRLVAVVKGRHRVKKSVGFLIPVETVIDFIRANIDYVQ